MVTFIVLVPAGIETGTVKVYMLGIFGMPDNLYGSVAPKAPQSGVTTAPTVNPAAIAGDPAFNAVLESKLPVVPPT